MKIEFMKLICVLCAVVLLLAFLPMPSLYYKALRVVVSVGAIAVLTQEFQRDVSLLGITFIAVLLVFNPIMPIYLYKKILWMPLDFATALLFLVYAYKHQFKNN